MLAGAGYALKRPGSDTGEKQKFQPAGWRLLDEQLKQKDEEEKKRLLYVAMTRAGKKLILSGVAGEEKKPEDAEQDAGRGSWMARILKNPELAEGAVRTPVPAEASGRRIPALAETQWFVDLLAGIENKTDTDREGGGELRERARDIIRSSEIPQQKPARTIDLPVSAYAAWQKSREHYRHVYEWEYPDRFEDAERYRMGEEAGEGDVSAADFGTAMHKLLELTNFSAPEERLDERIGACFSRFSAKDRTRARALYLGFCAGKLLPRLAAARRICREVPFVLNERHGIVYGVIDALFEDSRGDWHIVDYKTAEGNPERVRQAGYDLQIEIYAHACRCLTGKTPKSAVLYFLINQWEHCISLNDKSIIEIANRFRSFQEQVLTGTFGDGG